MILQIREIEVSSILTPQKTGALESHYDYTLNPYAGCAFACSYCYVPKFPNREYQSFEWGKWVNVKVNAPELLRKDRQKVFGNRIFFSSATDPYQYLELKYRLTRRCLQELLRYQPAKVTMHTRSHLMLEDLELLKDFGASLNVGVSLTTLDEQIARQFEPGAPSVKRRLELIQTLRASGINVYASVAPLLPCDPHEFARTLSGLVERVWVEEMHWPEVNNRPELLEKYAEFFQCERYKESVETVKSYFRRGDNLWKEPREAHLVSPVIV